MDSPPTVLVIGLGSVAVIILLGTCCACFAKKSEEENPQLDQQQQQFNSAHNQRQRNPSNVQQQERLSMQQPIAIRLSFSTINELDNVATVNSTTIQSSDISMFDPPPSYESVVQDLKQQIL
jgi:hypothetical protein